MMQTKRQQHVGLQPQNTFEHRRHDVSPSNANHHHHHHSIPLSFSSCGYETLLKPKKIVSFSTVEIREYKVILGDNPNCPLPLCLDWERTLDSTVMNVHYYEVLQERRGRRHNQKLVKMDVYLRKIRLLNMGYSKRVLHKAQQEFELRNARRTNKAAYSSRCHRTKKWTLPEME